MIFRHDCGQCASVTGWQPLCFGLHSGHFATAVAFRDSALSWGSLAIRWLDVGWKRARGGVKRGGFSSPKIEPDAIFPYYFDTSRHGAIRAKGHVFPPMIWGLGP